MNTLQLFNSRLNSPSSPLSLINEKDSMLRSFDSIFDDFFRDSFPMLMDLGVSATKGSYPKVNVISYDDKIEFVAELAGLTKEDVDIGISGDKKQSVLTISGKSPLQNKEVNDSQYYIRELKRSAFKRSFTIVEEVDVDKIDAKFDNGLLTISIPRLKPLQETTISKKVTIK